MMLYSYLPELCTICFYMALGKYRVVRTVYGIRYMVQYTFF